jgi:hypothetical protein
LGTGPTGIGLSPPLLVSTDPNGIPAVEPLAGNPVDIADDEGALPVELVSHVPDVGVMPGNGIPIVIPPPSYVVVVPGTPADELPPRDDPPWAGHATPLLVIPIEPVGTGLRPADGNSVAPIATPVGGTGVPAVMPSGEVAPIPGTVSPIWATAGSHANSTASVEAISADRILACTVTRQRAAGGRAHPLRATHRVRSPEGPADRRHIEFGLSAIGAAALLVFVT